MNVERHNTSRLKFQVKHLLYATLISASLCWWNCRLGLRQRGVVDAVHSIHGSLTFAKTSELIPLAAFSSTIPEFWYKRIVEVKFDNGVDQRTLNAVAVLPNLGSVTIRHQQHEVDLSPLAKFPPCGLTLLYPTVEQAFVGTVSDDTTIYLYTDRLHIESTYQFDWRNSVKLCSLVVDETENLSGIDMLPKLEVLSITFLNQQATATTQSREYVYVTSAMQRLAIAVPQLSRLRSLAISGPFDRHVEYMVPDFPSISKIELCGVGLNPELIIPDGSKRRLTQLGVSEVSQQLPSVEFNLQSVGRFVRLKELQLSGFSVSEFDDEWQLVFGDLKYSKTKIFEKRRVKNADDAIER